MTSRTSAHTETAGRGSADSASPLRRAFTLIELLLVIAIIAILAALLLPTIGNARRTAMRTAMGYDLQTITTALNAYKADYNDYPRVPGPATPDPLKKGFEGAIVLCQALIGPTDKDDLDDDDGNGDPITVATAEKKDFGARKRFGGKVYGPYIPTDRFKTRIIDNAPVPPAEAEATAVILGKDDQPILYFPASSAKPNIKLVAAMPPQPYADQSDTSRYDFRDNMGPTTPADKLGPFMREGETDYVNALHRFRLVLGDTQGLTATDKSDGAIQATETDIDVDFLLWSAGPDELFGPNADLAGDRGVLDAADAAKCDDVTNFR